MAQIENLIGQLRYAASTGVRDVRPFDQVVWHDELPSDMPSGQYTFVFSGPPVADQALINSDLLTPIGLVTDIQYNAQRQITPLAELGNRYYRHVGGRWSHSATLNRIVSREGNIIGMFYRWALAQGVSVRLEAGHEDSRISEVAGINLQQVAVESDLLSIPFGLYVVELTENSDFISAAYWEKCMIAGYGKTIQSGQATILESVQLVMARSIPAGMQVSGGTFVGFDLQSGNERVVNNSGVPTAAAPTPAAPASSPVRGNPFSNAG